MASRKIFTRSKSLCLPTTFNRPINRNKKCDFPDCGNTQWAYPEKLFFCAPRIHYTRHKWLEIAGLNPAIDRNLTRNVYFCEDHFDMENSIVDRTRIRVKYAKFKDSNYTIGSINGCESLLLGDAETEYDYEPAYRRTRSHTDNLTDITIVNIKSETDIKLERDTEDYEQHYAEIFDYGLDIKEERILTPDSAIEDCNQSRSSNYTDNEEPGSNGYEPVTQDCEQTAEFHTHDEDEDRSYNYYSNNFYSNGSGNNFNMDMVQIQSITSDPATWSENSASIDSESIGTNNENMFKGIMTITLNIFDNNFVCCRNIEKASPGPKGKCRNTQKKDSGNFETVNLGDRSYIKLLFSDKKVHPANSRVRLSNIQNLLDKNKSYCIFCKRLFQDYAGLLDHFVDAHLRSLTCSLCNNCFVDKYDLMWHLKTVHDTVMFGAYRCEPQKLYKRRGRKKCPMVYLFQCLTCERTLKLIDSIKYHVQEGCSQFSKFRYIRCNRCDLLFTGKSFKYHERWHKSNAQVTKANIDVIQFSKSKCEISDIKREIQVRRKITMKNLVKHINTVQAEVS